MPYVYFPMSMVGERITCPVVMFDGAGDIHSSHRSCIFILSSEYNSFDDPKTILPSIYIFHHLSVYPWLGWAVPSFRFKFTNGLAALGVLRLVDHGSYRNFDPDHLFYYYPFLLQQI